MIVGNTARLAINIYGEHTLGYYTNQPGKMNREARYQQHKGTRAQLLSKAHALGVTHLFDGTGSTSAKPLSEVK